MDSNSRRERRNLVALGVHEKAQARGWCKRARPDQARVIGQAQPAGRLPPTAGQRRIPRPNAISDTAALPPPAAPASWASRWLGYQPLAGAAQPESSSSLSQAHSKKGVSRAAASASPFLLVGFAHGPGEAQGEIFGQVRSSVSHTPGGAVLSSVGPRRAGEKWWCATRRFSKGKCSQAARAEKIGAYLGHSLLSSTRKPPGRIRLTAFRAQATLARPSMLAKSRLSFRCGPGPRRHRRKIPASP